MTLKNSQRHVNRQDVCIYQGSLGYIRAGRSDTGLRERTTENDRPLGGEPHGRLTWTVRLAKLRHVFRAGGLTAAPIAFGRPAGFYARSP